MMWPSRTCPHLCCSVHAVCELAAAYHALTTLNPRGTAPRRLLLLGLGCFPGRLLMMMMIMTRSRSSRVGIIFLYSMYGVRRRLKYNNKSHLTLVPGPRHLENQARYPTDPTRAHLWGRRHQGPIPSRAEVFSAVAHVSPPPIKAAWNVNARSSRLVSI